MRTQSTIKEATIKLPNKDSFVEHLNYMKEIIRLERENEVQLELIDSSEKDLEIVLRAEYECEDFKTLGMVASLSFLSSKGVEIGKVTNMKTIRDCTTIAQDALEEWA